MYREFFEEIEKTYRNKWKWKDLYVEIIYFNNHTLFWKYENEKL